MRESLLDDLIRFLEFGPDPLRNGGILLCGLVFLGGMVQLSFRVKAARRGEGSSGSPLAWRMIAVLGVLGGFVAYLRDLQRPGARLGLVLGGLSALPWTSVMVLEAVRRRWRGGSGSGRGRGE